MSNLTSGWNGPWNNAGDLTSGDDEHGSPPAANEAGGLASDTESTVDPTHRRAFDYLSGLRDRVMSAGAAPLGQNAMERWKGTPSVGLSLFKRREPIYAFRKGRGEVRQIDASTHMASPPSGLIGGRALENAAKGFGVSSLTPQAQWDALFPKYGGTYARASKLTLPMIAAPPTPRENLMSGDPTFAYA